MSDAKDLIAKRKRAYEFIVGCVKNRVLLPNIDSDRALAELLCRPEDLRDRKISVEAEIESMYVDLIALKEGRANPSQRLIDGFRAYFDGMVLEDDIEAYLITPFKKA